MKVSVHWLNVAYLHNNSALATCMLVHLFNTLFDLYNAMSSLLFVFSLDL